MSKNIQVLTTQNICRINQKAGDERTPFADIKEQFGLLEKEVISIMKKNLKRNSFLKWRQRVRGRKTKIERVSDRFKSKMQKT